MSLKSENKPVENENCGAFEKGLGNHDNLKAHVFFCVPCPMVHPSAKHREVVGGGAVAPPTFCCGS